MHPESRAPPEELKFKEKSFDFEQSLRTTDLILQLGRYLDLHKLLIHASALVPLKMLSYLVWVGARHGHFYKSPQMIQIAARVESQWSKH